MSEYKVNHRIYTAWNYESEIDELNRQSVEGWQLIHGGCLHSKFEKDPGVVYRYQIDFHPKLENKVRYVETFREQGWEFINSTFNGWHYFRKLYDSSLDEEEYEIYTDEDSKKELSSRWNRMTIIVTSFMTLFLAVMVIRMIQEPALIRVPLILFYIVLTAMMGKAMYMMNKRSLSKRGKGDKHLFLFLCIFAMVCFFVNEVMIIKRASISANYYSQQRDAIQADEKDELGNFKVSYSDFYYLDININMSQPVDFSIINEKDEAVYNIRGQQVDKENVRLLIKPGKYRIVLSDFEGGDLEVHYKLD